MENLIDKELLEFKVEAYHDGKFEEVTHKDVKGKWAIFFFYPADFTFVCPTELADLQDYYEELKSMDCEVYSVSCDSHFVHKAWADTSDTIGKIKYPMLADPTGKLADFFGILVKDTFQALRGTFIIDPHGKVKAYEVHDMGIGRNAEELVRKVAAAQFVAKHGNEVCPAKWKPGEDTLIPSLDLVGKI